MDTTEGKPLVEPRHSSASTETLISGEIEPDHDVFDVNGTGGDGYHTAFPKFTLSWKDVNVYVVPKPSWREKIGLKPKACAKPPDHILRYVSGSVESGIFLSVIGPSYSGKTTFLNFLACRSNSILTQEGTLRINDVDVGKQMLNILGFVQKNVVFYECLTVKEHLTFWGTLTLGGKVKEKSKRIRDVIAATKLDKVVDRKLQIAPSTCGITMADRKRVMIAEKLLRDPPVLFLDEPDCDIDQTEAEELVQMLKLMAAKSGMIVISTFNRPSSNVYSLLERVMYLANGRTAFLGEAYDAIQFFSGIGYSCPTFHNPPDYYVANLTIVPERSWESSGRIEEICDAYEKSVYGKRVLNRPTGDKKEDEVTTAWLNNQKQKEAGYWKQFTKVLWRTWIVSYRQRSSVLLKIVGNLVFALFLGMLFSSQKMDQLGVMNRNGLLFLLIIVVSFSSAFAEINTFPLALSVFLRDRFFRLYSGAFLILSVITVRLPLTFVNTALLVTIVYWMTSLRASASSFFICLGTIWTAAEIATGFGLMMAVITGKMNTGILVATPTLMVLALFGGFFLNIKSVPVYLVWLKAISWFDNVFEILAVNQWNDIHKIDCNIKTNDRRNNVSTVPCFINGGQVLSYLDFKEANIPKDSGLLVMLYVIFILATYLTLYVKARKYRRT